MTQEERRQYQREYQQKNRDRINEQRMNRIRQKALEDLASVNSQPVDVCIIKTLDNGEYHTTWA